MNVDTTLVSISARSKDSKLFEMRMKVTHAGTGKVEDQEKDAHTFAWSGTAVDAHNNMQTFIIVTIEKASSQC